MGQWDRDWWHLYRARTQVQFPGGISGLKDPMLLQLWFKSYLCLGSDPWLGNSVYRWMAKNEKKVPSFLPFSLKLSVTPHFPVSRYYGTKAQLILK